MEKNIIEKFDKFRKLNLDDIKNGRNFVPKSIILDKDNKLCVALMPFSSIQEKEIVKEAMKRFILNKPTKAYMFCCDSKATAMNEKGEVTSVKDALIEAIFTPNEVITYMTIYEDKEIIEQSESLTSDSEWNVWSRGKINNFLNERYNDYKNKNPDKYKDC